MSKPLDPPAPLASNPQVSGPATHNSPLPEPISGRVMTHQFESDRSVANDSESDRIASEATTGDLAHRLCQECSAPFVPATHNHPHQRHCSRPCQLAGHRRRLGHVPMGTEVVGTCADCAEPFTFKQRKRPVERCAKCREIRERNHHAISKE